MTDSQQPDSSRPDVSKNVDGGAERGDAQPFALLNTLGGHAFEDLIEHLLRKMGFHIEGRQPSADGGIDLVARRGDAIIGGKYVIQCKRYSNAVGNAAVRDLYGVVHAEAANKGVLVTNSTFTKEARRFAEGIELIDGRGLQELLMQHGLLATGYSSAQKKLSAGIQLVYAQLVNALARILDESEKLASGLIYVPQENVDHSRYNRIVQRHLGQYVGCMKTLEPLLDRVQPILNNHDPSADELSSLQGYIKELLGMSRVLLKIQREAQSLVPPLELSKLLSSTRRLVRLICGDFGISQPEFRTW